MTKCRHRVSFFSGYLTFESTRDFLSVRGRAVGGRVLGAGPWFDIFTAWRLMSSMEFPVGAASVPAPTKRNDLFTGFLGTRFFLLERILPGQTRNEFIVSSFMNVNW